MKITVRPVRSETTVRLVLNSGNVILFNVTSAVEPTVEAIVAQLRAQTNDSVRMVAQFHERVHGRRRVEFLLDRNALVEAMHKLANA